MQTFIPHVDSFRHIAEELDNKRLNKQILEAWQLLLVLSKLDPTGNDRNPKGWANHPAANMWRGHELVLADYARHMHTEWIKRGYKSTMLPKIDATIDRALQLKRINDEYAYPFWMKDPFKHIKLAASHRVALLVKDYDWYSQFNWPEDTGSRPDYYQYLWPNADGELYLGTYNLAV